MKKYNIVNLYVIEINNVKYICEPIVLGEEYKEVLTGRVIKLEGTYFINKLSDFYQSIMRKQYLKGESLMLSKNDILLKYIEINEKFDLEDNSDIKESIKEDTSLDEIIELAMPEMFSRNSFFRRVGLLLTPEERERIKPYIEDKSCFTCTNGCCRVEQCDKDNEGCIGWENDRIIGEYKVLKMNRR